jgi:threonine dehydratase
MLEAMRLLANQLKLIVEPAGAAALAALLKEPLHSQLQGKRVGILLCGSNIDIHSFSQLLAGKS